MAALSLIAGLIVAVGAVFLMAAKPLRISVPIVCIVAIVYSALGGNGSARRDLATDRYDFTVRAKSGTSFDAVLLKAGSNFTIFKNSQRAIVIMPTADVATIERRAP